MQWKRFAHVGFVLSVLSLVLVDSLGAKGNLFAEAPGPPIAMDGSPSDLAFSDVNQDGHLDLVVAVNEEPAIVVLLGDGKGAFEVASAKPLTLSDGLSEMAVGDLNGDRLPDLAMITHDSYNVMLAVGDGKGGFSFAATSPAVMKTGDHPHTHGLGIGDLNGDGSLDLVTANNEDNDIVVALNDGKGGFTASPASPFAVEVRPYPLTLGDVNNDGVLDIISSSTGPTSRSMTILLGDGQGDFEARTVSLETVQPWFPAIGDLNRDGNPDFVTTHWERHELTVMLGDGGGNFEEIAGSPFDLEYNAWETSIADVNDDGHADILVAGGSGVVVMIGNGKGEFFRAPDSPYPTGGGNWRFTLGDVNGDGKLDIATSNLESNSVSILLGQEE